MANTKLGKRLKRYLGKEVVWDEAKGQKLLSSKHTSW